MAETFEFRCPVHGFIGLDEWEREIISQRPFQRLRRIRQLAWTDQVYPGAMHTRFEHSLGVMHTATLLFDSITQNSTSVLESSELRFDQHSLHRQRRMIRLAALLHDLGHSPFSHGAEDLFPDAEDNGRKYEHEDYSAAIVRNKFASVIDDHPFRRRRRGSEVLSDNGDRNGSPGNPRTKVAVSHEDCLGSEFAGNNEMPVPRQFR